MIAGVDVIRILLRASGVPVATTNACQRRRTTQQQRPTKVRKSEIGGERVHSFLDSDLGGCRRVVPARITARLVGDALHLARQILAMKHRYHVQLRCTTWIRHRQNATCPHTSNSRKSTVKESDFDFESMPLTGIDFLADDIGPTGSDWPVDGRRDTKTLVRMPLVQHEGWLHGPARRRGPSSAGVRRLRRSAASENEMHWLTRKTTTRQTRFALIFCHCSSNI